MMDESVLKNNKSKQNNQRHDLYFSDQQQQEQDSKSRIKNNKEIHSTADQCKQQQNRSYCGCGQQYSCKSLLFLHIRSKHAGVSPAGTIGGPKGIIKNHHLNNGKIQQSQIKETLKKYPQSKIMNSQPSKITKNNFLHHENQQIFICELCKKVYGSITALKFHIKRKHTNNNSNNIKEDPSQKKIFQCTLCGRSYGSKSALGLHITNKHNVYERQKIVNQHFPFIKQDFTEKCGCGRIYDSRSALNMHIKRKHNGVILKGTTLKGPRRTYTQSLEEKLISLDIENHFRSQRSSSSEHQNQNNIYCSQDQQQSKTRSKNHLSKSQSVKNPAPIQNKLPPQKSVVSFKASKKNSVDPLKPFQCGCGRRYSCSSSLNLHIKKDHNFMIPLGTIGGPRGIRCQDGSINKLQSPQQQIICSKCKLISNNSYFKCQTCNNHYMCPVCFWGSGGSVFGKQHDWILKDKH